VKIRRNKTITDKLLRIETDLLRGTGLSVEYCSSYISWATKFGKITDNESDYLCDLVLYRLGRLTVDEEIVLMDIVATRPI
jgi:hypothetical protein